MKMSVKWGHIICRNGVYPQSNVTRFPVPDELCNWPTKVCDNKGYSERPEPRREGTDWPEYAPVEYTSPTVHGKPWADPDISDPSFKPQFNAVDGDIDRRSYKHDAYPEYDLSPDGRPINPRGRTGITGRGLLGRWGPNHAADAIITRWKPTLTPADGGLDVLQFVAIQRKDTKQWAIPGGMVDPGESISKTLKREFMEEALNSLEEPQKSKRLFYEKKMPEIFAREEIVYKGYVDDPRNTDNAWMETTAANFHDNDDLVMKAITLSAGDDACGVMWMDIDANLELYAEHKMLLQCVARLRNAHWETKHPSTTARPLWNPRESKTIQ